MIWYSFLIKRGLTIFFSLSKPNEATSLEGGDGGLVRRRGGAASPAEPLQPADQRVGVDAAARQARVLTRLPIDRPRRRVGRAHRRGPRRRRGGRR